MKGCSEYCCNGACAPTDKQREAITLRAKEAGMESMLAYLYSWPINKQILQAAVSLELPSLAADHLPSNLSTKHVLIFVSKPLVGPLRLHR
jgi:hypothetical protein